MLKKLIEIEQAMYSRYNYKDPNEVNASYYHWGRLQILKELDTEFNGGTAKP